jgi:hypothetical protein
MRYLVVHRITFSTIVPRLLFTATRIYVTVMVALSVLCALAVHLRTF